MPLEQLSHYDEQVLRELLLWKRPPTTARSRALDRVERTIEWLANLIPTKRLEWVLGKVLPMAGELTRHATSKEQVLSAYRRDGQVVKGLSEIAALPLRTADRVAGDKQLQEAATAGLTGFTAGLVGGPVVLADIAGCTLLALRSVQSRGLVYGFDPAAKEELAFVLQVLDAASRVGPNGKALARGGLAQLGTQLAQRKLVAKALERLLERLPKQVVARLLALKSNSAVPLLGAATGAGFNAWYLREVTRTAHMAYRERFLRRRYGDDLLEAFGH